MSWNTGRDYKIGDWIIDESADLDEFFERLADLRRSRGAQVIPFRAQAVTTAPAPTGGATVIPFGPIERTGRAAMSEFDRIRSAFLEQRQRADDRVRQGKIERNRAEIAALAAQDLSVETEVRLDILRREFAEVRVKEGESLLDIYMEDGHE